MNNFRPGQITKELISIFQYFNCDLKVIDTNFVRRFNHDNKVLDIKITLFTVSIVIEKF